MMKHVSAIAAMLAACASAAGPGSAETTELTMWYHGAGNETERQILAGIVDDFNGSQSDWSVRIEQFPQAVYNDSVTAAALAGDLPDILDVDGPIMPNWAWSGYLAPLGIAEETLDGFLPGPIGKWDGEIYSVGLWDAAVAMFARRSVLDAHGIRVPTLEQPWNAQEFDAALIALKESGEFEYPLDLGMAWTGEWYPYAFSPFLQSFGGDIVDRQTYATAEGVLNGDAGLAFGEWWQGLFERGLAQATQDPADRDIGFVEGKYALSWNGNWAALPPLEKFGEDLLFLPAPDFGNGPKIGAASWQFGVSARSEHQDGAKAFITFALRENHMAAFSDGVGLIPPTRSAAAMTTNYKEGGPLATFYDLSEAQALLRPVTPGYVVAAKVFEKALSDIADGADVAETLDASTDEINADIEKNGGYGH